jgi:hypothetical protein
VHALARASATKTATIFGVSRAVVSKVMLPYTNQTSAKGEQWMKINTSSYIEKGCFEKSHNCSTGDRTAELNIHLKDPVFTKTVQREFHRSNIYSRAAIAKPPITESNAQMCK